MRKSILSFVLVSALLILASTAAAQMSIVGEVIDVIDGKTVVIAVATGRITAELQYIDVPGANQPLGSTVKEHLSHLVLGKKVSYRALTLYADRTIGRLLVDDTDVGMQMLRDGAAWHVPANISNQEKAEFDSYAFTENGAKSEKRGVWSIPALRPARESRAEKQATITQPKLSFVAESTSTSTRSQAKRGYWSDKNPALGDVGVLAHGYNAEAKSGYVGTSFLGVTEQNTDKAGDVRTAVDVTYFYKETGGDKRKGVFVVTLISESTRWRFLERNDLTIICGDKKTPIGKPKRVAESSGGVVREKLTYQIDRSAVDKIVNGDEVMLKVGDYLIVPAAGFQMLLYNMLQVAS